MSSIPFKYVLLLGGLILSFLLIKLPHLGIRMSDTNIYFYNGFQIAHGEVLYRDIFFTNFPLVPYIATVYYFFTAGNLTAYYFTAIIEVSLTAIFIFLIARKSSNDFVGLISSAAYLLSFIVLATTDHQTGVFAASLFEILSLYFFTRKNFFVTGIFAAASILTKAYFLPLALSYGTFLLVKKQYKHLGKFIGGALITAVIVLGPSLLFASTELFSQVFGYSLTRSAGLSKTHIIWFFILHDLPVMILLLFNLFQFKKHLLFSLFSLFSIVFIILYQDIYYLYLNVLVPILCASFPIFWLWIYKRTKLQQMVIPTILICFWLYNIYLYSSVFAHIQRFTDLNELVSRVKQENAPSIYGTNDIAPAVAYLSRVPLLNNITDTNENLYRKGILNATDLTTHAVEKNSVIISHGAFYPQFDVHEEVINRIFDEKTVLNNCRKVYRQPVVSEGYVNEINVFSCSYNLTNQK